MPKRTVIDAKTGRATVEDFSLTEKEISDGEAYLAEKRKRTTRFADIPPNVNSVADLREKMNEILAELRGE